MTSVLKPVLGGIATILGGGSSAPAAPPAAPPPAVMPTPDDAAVQAAKKKKIAEQVSASGRQSTILSQGATTDKLGG